MKWDTKLRSDLTREWKNIAKNFNASNKINIPRCVGNYESPYALLAFRDASEESYGTVLYLQNCETNEIPFLLSKIRVIPNCNSNSIPVLELQALTFGV